MRSKNAGGTTGGRFGSGFREPKQAPPRPLMATTFPVRSEKEDAPPVKKKGPVAKPKVRPKAAPVAEVAPPLPAATRPQTEKETAERGPDGGQFATRRSSGKEQKPRRQRSLPEAPPTRPTQSPSGGIMLATGNCEVGAEPEEDDDEQLPPLRIDVGAALNPQTGGPK